MSIIKSLRKQAFYVADSYVMAEWGFKSILG